MLFHDMIAMNSNIFTSFTFVASATSTTSTLTVPASAAIGDIAVLFDGAIGGVFLDSIVPTGFTIVNSGNYLTLLRLNSSYKILQANDLNSSLALMAGTSGNNKIIFIFRPNFGVISTVTVNNAQTESTISAPSNKTLSMSGGLPPLIGFGCWGATQSITTRGSTLSMTEVFSSVTMYAQYIIYGVGSTPSDSTLSMADYYINNLQCFYLTFT
jgi:hypothetical protein